MYRRGIPGGGVINRMHKSYTINVLSNFVTQNVGFNNTDNYVKPSYAWDDCPVWVMWWQGIEKAPEIVRDNINVLVDMFGNKVHVITEDNFKDFTDIPDAVIKKFSENKISFTHWSDLIRINVLKNNGGLWVDSTVRIGEAFKLPGSSVELFSLSNSVDNLEFISNDKWTGWFIAGPKGHPLFSFVDECFSKYWTRFDDQFEYFLIDYFIAIYLKNFPHVYAELVGSCSRKWRPYYLVNKLVTGQDADINIVANNIDYSVQKLTYKFDIDKAAPELLRKLEYPKK